MTKLLGEVWNSSREHKVDQIRTPLRREADAFPRRRRERHLSKRVNGSTQEVQSQLSTGEVPSQDPAVIARSPSLPS